MGVFECLECRCCLDRLDRGEEKDAVHNVFINYRNKHIGCEKHVANWRRRRNLPLNVGKKKTPEPQVNHHAETDAACAIMEKVNGEELSQKKPFIIEVRSGAKGRPKKFDPRDLKRQRCIDSFFVGAQSFGNVSNPSSIEDCEKEPGEVHSDLSLLCWGFWFTSAEYVGKVYDLKPFLDDQKRGCTWTVKRIRSTFVPFLPGLQDSNFEEVAKILTAAKALHGIIGDIAVILAEDETRVKPTVRKLMLEDYLGSEGQRWIVGWDKWVLSGIVVDFGDVYALGDQDPIHNGKKMINPLDRSSYPIALGDFHACLEHVQLVYKLYSHDHHGLNIDDVIRRDR
ncbi:hypothetical protein R1flu_021723 [Riccia fluitans]|uniref:Uncharacterized protein n=1 Tax=Riccia fluitans TaxID=41844 RepID=A0ABD1ZQ65_9MARC